MFHLPRDIINRIFEFDPTYKLYFNRVVKELEDCTSFFRVVTLTDINDENMWWVFISSHFNYLDREKFSNRLDLKTKNHKAIMDFTTVERMDTNLQKEDLYKYLNMIPKNILEILCLFPKFR